MALGKINLLSSKAAAPIGNAEEGKEYMICDTFQQYRAAYERIRRDPGFSKKIGENAQENLSMIILPGNAVRHYI